MGMVFTSVHVTDETVTEISYPVMVSICFKKGYWKNGEDAEKNCNWKQIYDQKKNKLDYPV